MKILLIDTVYSYFTESLTAKGFECIDGSKLTKEEILAVIHLYEGIQIRSRIKVDNAFLDKATKLKFIARAGAGMESIDENYAAQKGIACISAPEGNRDAVGEHAVGMLLSLFNNLNRADQQVRKGEWLREANRGVELNGKTVGIIGYGNMGTAFAQCVSGFGVTTLAYDKYKTNYSDKYASQAPLNDLFEHADILSLHLPFTDETNYMVNDAFLSSFKKDIYLINTARGKIVNTADLVKHLKSGKVKGACLDVLEYESQSFENFNADTLPAPYQYIIKSDKVLLSPHIAGWTIESKRKIAEVLVEKILKLKLS
jgi:D-3-phosphoglycerate dehydrogenase